MLKKIVVLAALTVVTVAACESTVSDPTPVKEPQRVDCDLIFPAPAEGNQKPAW